MPRLRTIKNEFFTDDKVAELSKASRLLFIGLWTVADREGRLEDRPKRIKVMLMPYDDDDVDDLLRELSEAKFIIRYEAEGEGYIQIKNFVKHQHPHPKEPESLIPCPKEMLSREKKRQAAKSNGRNKASPGETSTSKVNNGDMNNGEWRGNARDGTRASNACDDEYLNALQQREIYAKLDVRRIYGKMVVWCEANNKQPTRKRLVNWLNREDVPMNASGHREHKPSV